MFKKMLSQVIPIQVIAVTIILFSLIVPANLAAKGAKKSSQQVKPESVRPLYADSTGWQIVAALATCNALERYTEIMSQGGIIAEYSEKLAPAFMPYIYQRGCSFFYAFRVDVPASVNVYWKPESAIVINYVYGRDTLQATSNTIFFLSADTKKISILAERKDDFKLPNAYYIHHTSEREFYLMFARFSYKKSPDLLLSCSPVGVYSIELERR